MTRRMQGPRHPEQGAATVAVVSLVGVVLLVALAAATVLGAAVSHRQAQAAADLAALAGAVREQEGSDPCAAAAEVAAANGARLDTCRADGADVVVTVTVEIPGDLPVLHEVAARARAGPS